MKKKIVIATSILSLAVAGVVSAASIWGTYKGNDIIRLTVDGDPVKVSDVPAISYNDRTMIPIYLLKQAGIDYTWDQKNKTVNVESTDNSHFSTWAYCASYIHKLTDLANDFDNLSDLINSVSTLISVGMNNNDKELDDLKSLNNELSYVYQKYTNLITAYSNTVKSKYESMNMSTSKINDIESLYKNSADNLSNSYQNISLYQSTSQLKYFSDAYSYLITASNGIKSARQIANDEFNLFQDAIIANQK